MGDHTRRLGHGAIGAPRHGTSPQRQVQESRLATRPPAGDPRTPEFLSLTYTLPYHLVEQVDENARTTNRSRSEVLADAIRSYLQNGAAPQEHTHVARYEEVSYQEIRTEDVPGGHNGHGNSPAAEPAGTTISESTRNYFRAWAAREERTGVSTFESYSYQEVTEGTVADGRHESEVPLPVLDVSAQATKTAPPPSRTTDAAAPALLPEPQPEAKPDFEPVPEPEADLEAESDTEPEADPELEMAAEPSAEPEPELEPMSADPPAPAAEPVAPTERSAEPAAETAGGDAEPSPVDDRPDGTVTDTHDPAEEIRRRLNELANEPFDSDRVERCLAEVARRVDTKDFSPPEHSTKVASMARDVAAATGMRGAQIQAVYIAGLVHDIGKACIPDEIISKPRPTSDEMALIREYPTLGVDLLAAIPALAPVLPIVAAHQERWNGSGYPEGASRGDIPAGAQIVALCDVYDMLNTARRYRPAYTSDRALQIIKQNVGALWSPDIARVFLAKMVAEGRQAQASARG